jgi:hypothetical protein
MTPWIGIDDTPRPWERLFEVPRLCASTARALKISWA